MLNRVILMGHMVANPELKTTADGISVTSFRIAVDRSYVKSGEERKADFIDIVCWRQPAEFVCRYFSKGSLIAVEGQLQSRTYQAKDGTNRYVVEVVSDNYKICQNSKAFEFIDYVADDLKFERAGMTSYGKCYVIAALPKINILGDEFTPHLIFQNGFNGKIALKVAIVPLRIVCQNQFNIAFKEANNAISIRHYKTMEEELSEAREMLKNTNEYLKVLREKAELYAGIKLDNLNLSKVFDFLFPRNDEMSDIQLAHLQIKKEEFIRAYDADDNSNFKGTAWGVINAMSDYMTHYTPTRMTKKAEENKFDKVTFTPYLNTLSEFLMNLSVGG